MIAGEKIPFGEPIKVVDGTWLRSSLADMTGVSARPRWANRTHGGPVDLPTAFQTGEEVETIADGTSFLMLVPERVRRGDGTVILTGQPEMVTLVGGKLAGLEAF